MLPNPRRKGQAPPWLVGSTRVRGGRHRLEVNTSQRKRLLSTRVSCEETTSNANINIPVHFPRDPSGSIGSNPKETDGRAAASRNGLRSPEPPFRACGLERSLTRPGAVQALHEGTWGSNWKGKNPFNITGFCRTGRCVSLASGLAEVHHEPFCLVRDVRQREARGHRAAVGLAVRSHRFPAFAVAALGASGQGRQNSCPPLGASGANCIAGLEQTGAILGPFRHQS